MSTTTTNLGLTLPTPNVDSGWGGTLNTDFTLIDDIFAASGAGTSVGLNVGSGKTINVGGTAVLGGTVILGAGDATASTTAPTIRGAARTGTNAAGGNITVDAMNGTGTGGSGKIIFRTAPAGSSGVSANTMASVFELNSAGAIGVGGASYGTSKQALISNGSAAAASWSTVDGTVLSITSQAQGDILYRGASAWERLAAGTSGQFLKTSGAGAAPAWSNVITQSASQTIASAGNSFTGIPAGVKQITIAVSGLTPTSSITARVRLGTSGGFVSSGYVSSGSWFRNDSGGGGDGSTDISTSGMVVNIPNDTYTLYGTVRITNLTGNQWVCDHTMGSLSGSNGAAIMGGGSITLGGVLDRVQIVPVTGAFSGSGTVSITYS